MDSTHGAIGDQVPPPPPKKSPPPKPPPKKTPLLDAAISYAQCGWPVLPVHSIRDGKCTCHRRRRCKPGKHPRIKGGHAAGTTERDKIEEWWTMWPDANVGIVTGAISNLLVIDVDPRHDGEENINKLIAMLGPLPPGPTVRTGGGGWHRYFQHPGGKVTSRSNISPGVDIRADDVYAVAPPSVHVSGKSYSWVKSPDSYDLPVLPDVWLDWLAKVGCYTSGASNSSNSSSTSGASNAAERIEEEEVEGGKAEVGPAEDARFPAVDAGSLGDHVDRCLQATIPGNYNGRGFSGA